MHPFGGVPYPSEFVPFYDGTLVSDDCTEFLNGDKLNEHPDCGFSLPSIVFNPTGLSSPRSTPDLVDDNISDVGSVYPTYSLPQADAYHPAYDFCDIPFRENGRAVKRSWLEARESYIAQGLVPSSVLNIQPPPLAAPPSSFESPLLQDGVLSDKDAAGESDDEYLPPRESTSRQRRRSSIRVRRKSTTSSSKPSAKTPYPVTKRPRLAPPSRNRQASASTSAAIQKAVDEASAAATNYVCPECGWKQANHRLPDFKRHMKTHTRASDDDETSGWWCKGLLYEDFLRLPSQEQDRIRDTQGGDVYTFLDKLRIGGCRMTFSRRDALKRHLDNDSKPCVGRPCGPLED